ncbi:MAG: hypothetical protein MZW92_22365 [Comamonadaceae bacterium]|nr:hypothetical protein [Comamonadaceae bacterium]
MTRTSPGRARSRRAVLFRRCGYYYLVRELGRSAVLARGASGLQPDLPGGGGSLHAASTGPYVDRDGRRDGRRRRHALVPEGDGVNWAAAGPQRRARHRRQDLSPLPAYRQSDGGAAASHRRAALRRRGLARAGGTVSGARSRQGRLVARRERRRRCDRSGAAAGARWVPARRGGEPGGRGGATAPEAPAAGFAAGPVARRAASAAPAAIEGRVASPPAA